MSEIVRAVWMVALALICNVGLACTPALEHLLERDMAGDPSGRVAVAVSRPVFPRVTENTESDFSRPAFELDADPLELATSWRIIGSSVVTGTDECLIVVEFRVVAETKGAGVPAWNRNVGREIVPLPFPVNKSVQFRFQRRNGLWKVPALPVPRIAPQVLRDFLRDELKKYSSISFPARADKRAFENNEVVQIWLRQQLSLLDQLSL